MVDRTQMRNELRNTLREVLDDIPPNRVNHEMLRKRLHEMIDYAIGRVDYYERYRSTYQTIAMGLIAGSFIITTILLRGINAYSLIAISFIFLAVLTLLSGAVYILWIYSKETSPNYAYRDVADIRSWYYKYYFRDFEKGGDISPPQGSPERETQAETYFEGLKSYIRTWVRHATDRDDLLLEDIEQVYILFALQSFKRRFAQRASNALRWCALASAVLLTLGVLFVISPPGKTPVDSPIDRGLQLDISMELSDK